MHRLSVAAFFKMLFARLAIAMILVVALAAHSFRRLVRNSDLPRNNDIAIIGTFYNDGWFEAHARPLIESEEVGRLYIISDRPIQTNSPKIVFRCPGETSRRFLGRQLSRLATLLSVGWSCRPAIYMGYHIMPNAPLAVFAAALFRGKSAYQMTGGPLQIQDGGYLSENPLLRATARPSRLQERLLFALLRRIDAVVVRGSSAKHFVQENRLSDHCFVITGAVDTTRFQAESSPKEYDLVYVGRILEDKGIELLLEVVLELAAHIPDLKVALVGDGADRTRFESETKQKNLSHIVSFVGQSDAVETYLAKSKAFILLSDSEGMSIAAIEAMASGLPVLCRDVGDLRDLVKHGVNGLLFKTNDAARIAVDIADRLKDDETLEHMSVHAQQIIAEDYSIRAMTQRWEPELLRLFGRREAAT